MKKLKKNNFNMIKIINKINKNINFLYHYKAIFFNKIKNKHKI